MSSSSDEGSLVIDEDCAWSDHGSPSLRRKYTDSDDKVIVDFIIKNDRAAEVRGKRVFQDLVKQDVIQRSVDSLYEHFREQTYPKLVAGIIPIEKDQLDKFPVSTYSPKKKKLEHLVKTTRTNVTKKEIITVAEYIANATENVCPTSKTYWEGILHSQEINIRDCHAARLVSIYRNHIHKKIGELEISDELKAKIKSKIKTSSTQTKVSAKPTDQTITAETSTSQAKSTKTTEEEYETVADSQITVDIPDSSQKSVSEPEIYTMGSDLTEGSNEDEDVLHHALNIAKAVYACALGGHGAEQKACQVVLTSIKSLYETSELI